MHLFCLPHSILLFTCYDVILYFDYFGLFTCFHVLCIRLPILNATSCVHSEGLAIIALMIIYDSGTMTYDYPPYYLFSFSHLTLTVVIGLGEARNIQCLNSLVDIMIIKFFLFLFWFLDVLLQTSESCYQCFSYSSTLFSIHYKFLFTSMCQFISYWTSFITVVVYIIGGVTFFTCMIIPCNFINSDFNFNYHPICMYYGQIKWFYKVSFVVDYVITFICLSFV